MSSLMLVGLGVVVLPVYLSVGYLLGCTNQKVAIELWLNSTPWKRVLYAMLFPLTTGFVVFEYLGGRLDILFGDSGANESWEKLAEKYGETTEMNDALYPYMMAVCWPIGFAWRAVWIPVIVAFLAFCGVILPVFGLVWIIFQAGIYPAKKLLKQS